MRRPRPPALLVAATALGLLWIPAADAQNGPDDECVIRVQLHESLTEATIEFDLLFDDAAWNNFTSTVDGDGDGNVTRAEIDAYEHASRRFVSEGDFPAERAASLSAQFSKGPFSGTAVEYAQSAWTNTSLLHFEGPVGERAGKVVRDSWTYTFQDPLYDYDEARLDRHAKTITLTWGPESIDLISSVATVETVEAHAPPGWHLRADGDEVRSHTYPVSATGSYQVTFWPDDPPSQRTPLAAGPIPAMLLLGALAARRRVR